MMMNISNDDIQALKSGSPPDNNELLDYLTVPNEWLDLMKSYCLDSMIAQGGSKVKIIYGSSATGKTHYLMNFKNFALKNNFFVIDFDLSKVEFQLTDTKAFYKAIAAKVDLEKLEEVLCKQICQLLGYNSFDLTTYQGTLSDYLCQTEKMYQAEAKKEIRTAIHQIVNSLELEFSFHRFLHIFMEAIVEKDEHFKQIAKTWFGGEKLTRAEKTERQLYETLAKHNARNWIYSLLEIIKYMGYKGVVILLDQFESILPKSDAVVQYSPSKRNDVYQLLRQLIDDLDFFKNTLIFVSGNTEIINNEKYGLQSYHALWMRIQPGFQQTESLNLYADLIDTDLLFRDLQQKGRLKGLQEKMENLGVFQSRDASDTSFQADLGYRNFKDVLRNQYQI